MPNRNQCPQSASERLFGGVSLSSGKAAQVAEATSVVNQRSSDKVAERAKRHQRQLSDVILNETALNLLRSADAPGAAGLAICGTKPIAGTVELKLNKTTGKASFGGLRRCKGVWTCVCCARLVSSQRKDELNEALAEARRQGYAVHLVTLTARHDRQTNVREFLDGISNAKRLMCQRQEWRKIGVAGTVTALETLFGANGAHSHYHILVFTKCEPVAVQRQLKALAAIWKKCLQAYGLDCGKAGLDVQDGSAAGAYCAKWGLANEMTLTGEKQSRVGSRSPFQLLADAALGDAKAGRLFVEYAKAFSGRRQLTWSRGLKQRLGVGEVSDEKALELQEAKETAASDEVVTVRTFSSEEWAFVRHRRAAVLRAVERGASLDAALNGPTDRQRWQRINSDVWEEWP